MTRARIAIAGAGWWATQFHIPGLLANPAAELVAVVDPDAARAAAAAAAGGIARTHGSVEELVAAGGVDGVVVATPHVFHAPVARAALEGGLHVLVEKPFTLAGADARALVALAEARGLHLVVGYTYQFTRHAARARAAVQGGEIGEVAMVSALFASMVEAYYRGTPEDYRDVFAFPVTGPAPSTYSDPAIAGGGQAQTQITHALGMVHWVTGLAATEAFAYMANRGLRVDVCDALGYRLENGAVGTVAATGTLRAGQPQQQEIRYYGSEGFVLQELIHGTLEIHRNDGTREVLPPLAPDELYPTAATAGCLVDLILGRGENRAPGGPATACVELLEAAYRSVASGRPEPVGALPT